MSDSPPYLLPALAELGDRPAVLFGDRELSYRELAAAAQAVSTRVSSAERVAVWATSTLETVVGVVGALLAGVPVVPLNPRAGERELLHILADADPDLVLHGAGDDLPAAVRERPGFLVDPSVRDVPGAATPIAEPAPESPAVIVYTSGTTGPPKGVVLPRRAIATNLDALAQAWKWTGDDVVAHALPLFHVHGLILGVLGPLRRGGTVYHLGRLSAAAVAQALRGRATVLFGVPTMYHRLAEEATADPAIAQALAGARLLVSGSAALAEVDHERIAKATGQRVVERYGLTETVMNCAVRADGERRAGTVGLPLDGVEIKLVDDDGQAILASDDETIGEIAVRGPNLFLGYLNRPDATAEVMRDGWFHTGDLATRAADGYLRIVGRRATDLIKSGGFKIGAGEIENVLLEHPGVAEAAVTGAPDPDLGERVVAWIVPAEGRRPEPDELAERVARQLTPHKRPREFHYLDRLPRNDMGKVMKRALRRPEAGDEVRGG
ncbi:acyl-CoA synthetase [Micromonospora inositola]|uniref:Malonyl-CoA/methylmalonyl-CoA synthetase n=1 Tax=Micromonospora inositola TaxID=47865 RepID=A0A1C5K5C3_9ACTN|nr:acyl-CoA synthetase [Micromonospora inositola]SCG77974.1 malonyl-CoA/methylmalonyl-CoA synthetase [Micromonospora inositola]